jgi:toxin-antitoxin system PIN domain toxin
LSGAWLLDVNVLLAWLWPVHEAHTTAAAWMNNSDYETWVTCPVTEMGFLRIVTNPSFSPLAPRWKEAISLLRKQTTDHPKHSFWQDSLPLEGMDKLLGNRIQGSSQITDAYLLALAMHNRARMVTFDYRMATLAPAGSPEYDALLILRP